MGSSPTSRTKKTFGSFFVGGTLCFAQQTLCVWNPHCVAGARLRWSFSGVKLTLDCMSHQPHQKDLWVFFLLVGLLHFVQQMLCIWNPHRVAGTRLPLPISGVKLSLDCTSHHQHQIKGIEGNTSLPFVVHTHFFANFRANFFVKKHDILQRKRIFEKANIKHFKECAKKFILQNNQVLLLNFLHILYNDERRNFV